MSKFEVINGFSQNASASIDAKGRCSFPKELRKLLRDENCGEIAIAPSHDNTLTIYPALEWNDYVSKIEKRSRASKSKSLAFQVFMKLSSTQKLDAQSRFSLTKEQIQKFKIDKEVFFIGLNKTVAAMNQEEFDKRNDPDMDDLADLLMFDEADE